MGGLVFGPFLRDLHAIHEHGKRRKEQLTGLVGDRYDGVAPWPVTPGVLPRWQRHIVKSGD
jgi:hypothetical protein